VVSRYLTRPTCFTKGGTPAFWKHPCLAMRGYAIGTPYHKASAASIERCIGMFGDQPLAPTTGLSLLVSAGRRDCRRVRHINSIAARGGGGGWEISETLRADLGALIAIA